MLRVRDSVVNEGALQYGDFCGWRDLTSFWIRVGPSRLGQEPTSGVSSTTRSRRASSPSTSPVLQRDSAARDRRTRAAKKRCDRSCELSRACRSHLGTKRLTQACVATHQAAPGPKSSWRSSPLLIQC